MDKETRFRILNKTAKTVTVKLMDKPMTFSWEEFNKKLIVVDKVWAILNDAEKKKQEEADDLVNQAVVGVMLQRGNADAVTKMSALMTLSSIIDKLTELLECSKAEVMEIIRKRLMLMNPFMSNPMFSNDILNKNGVHHKKRYNKQEENSKPVHVFDEKKPTLGDAFSCLGELKDKLEKES